jgi:hypothetical protein
MRGFRKELFVAKKGVNNVLMKRDLKKGPKIKI